MDIRIIFLIIFQKVLEIVATVFGFLIIVFFLISSYKFYRAIVLKLRRSARNSEEYQPEQFDFLENFRKLLRNDVHIQGDVNISEKFRDATPEEKQYLLLEEYHNQSLTQSSISFWFSLISASFGFVIIALAIFSIKGETGIQNQMAAFVQLVSGTIINAVSTLFFIQTNKSRKLMSDFFDKLRSDRKINESLILVEKIPDNFIQSRAKAMIALSFVGIQLDEKILKSILSNSFDDTTVGDKPDNEKSV
jgi:hypothetical protein